MHSSTDINKLKYPIGDYLPTLSYSFRQIKKEISIIEKFHKLLKKEVSNLTDSELELTYRKNGWTIRQVVHHLADSHSNGLIRLKLALCEDKPTIKPYPEHLFAELADSKSDGIESSLLILKGVHQRLTTLLKTMSETDYHKSYFHPQYKKEFFMYDFLGLYSWHCIHHLAHIEIAKQKIKKVRQ
jgi:hypothetical protein